MNPHDTRPADAQKVYDAAYAWNPSTNVGSISVFNGTAWHSIPVNSTEEFIALLQVLKSREVWFLNNQFWGSL